MAHPNDLLWKWVEDLSLPYTTRENPIQGQQPIFVGGTNVITGLQGSAQRRPGFVNALEDTPTTFTGNIIRQFGWSTWAGVYFAMLNEVTATQSKVYKLKFGTDASFILLFTSAVTGPFDFILSANQVFFANGTDAKKWDGTTLTNWGIANTAVAPTVATTATGISATEGYQYVFTYGNSATTHQSSPSPESLSTGVFTNKRVDITGARSTDTQVDKVHVYRTTDGGGGVFFELVGSPIANPGSGTWTFNDTTEDEDLKSTVAPIAGANDPPLTGFKLFKEGYFANRIMGYVNNKMYLSNWEEQTGGVAGDLQVGVPEESFNPTNFFQTEDLILGGGPAGNTFLVMTGGNTWRLRGDSLDTFEWTQFLTGIGTRDRANFARAGQALMWFDNTVGLRASDGYSDYEFGSSMFAELSNITDHSTVSMIFFSGHFSGTIRKCLFLLNGEDSQLYIYDIANQRWMPPWIIGGRSIAVIQTSNTVREIVLGHSSKKALKMATTQAVGDYKDNGTAFAASIKTNAVPITPANYPGHAADLEMIAVDRNATAFSDVLILVDDEPINTTFTTTIFANVKSPPPLRSQGTLMLEQWFYARKPLARRCAVEIKWPAEDKNFSLIGLGFGSRKAQQ